MCELILELNGYKTVELKYKIFYGFLSLSCNSALDERIQCIYHVSVCDAAIEYNPAN